MHSRAVALRGCMQQLAFLWLDYVLDQCVRHDCSAAAWGSGHHAWMTDVAPCLIIMRARGATRCCRCVCMFWCI